MFCVQIRPFLIDEAWFWSIEAPYMRHGAREKFWIFFFNTLNRFKPYFFDGQTTTLEAQIQHEDDEQTQNWHQKQRQYPPYYLGCKGFGYWHRGREKICLVKNYLFQWKTKILTSQLLTLFFLTKKMKG